jgi:hypothetical protein
MKVVIDTNILLISLPSLSPYHEIIKAFNRKVFGFEFNICEQLFSLGSDNN